jgi:3-(3-hydroxy-phenyl)propionate hydroxylase
MRKIRCSVLLQQKMSLKKLEYDIVIIGVGPVGALTSALLRNKHLRILSLERDSLIYPAPRAVSMDDVAVRLHGLVRPELVQWVDGHTLKSPIETRSGPPSLNGQDTMNSFSFVGPNPAEIVLETGFHDIVFFHQPTYEARLRKEAFGELIQNDTSLLKEDTPFKGTKGTKDQPIQFDQPKLQFCEVTKIVTGSIGTAKMRGQRVLITAKDEEGKLFEISTRFVLASDGASSFVRKSLEIPYIGTSYPDEKWLVVDVATSDPNITQTWTNFNFICDPNRILVHCPVPGRQGARRFEFLLKHNELGDSMNTPSNVKSLLESIGVKYSNVTILRSVIYTFHARRAQFWRSSSCYGRVLLLGDAAHAMPPFRGQGMCTGLRDSVNLSWKVHQCCSLARESDQNFAKGNKEAEDSYSEVIEVFLQSYQIERESQVKLMVDVILVMGSLIMIQNRFFSFFRNLLLLIPERIPFTKGWFIKNMFSPPVGYNIGLFDFSRKSSCSNVQKYGYGYRKSLSWSLSSQSFKRDEAIGSPMPNYSVYSLPRNHEEKHDDEVLMQWNTTERLDEALWFAIHRTYLRKKLDSKSPPWIVLLSPKYSSSSSLPSISPSNGPQVVVIQVLPSAGSYTRMKNHRNFITNMSTQQTEPWFSRADEAVADATNRLSTWFNEMDCIAVVLRPDLYVFGAYSEEEWERGARYLETLFSAGQLKIQKRSSSLSYVALYSIGVFICITIFAIFYFKFY